MLTHFWGRAMLSLLQAEVEKAARERKNAAGQQVRSNRARAISSLASEENMGAAKACCSAGDGLENALVLDATHDKLGARGDLEQAIQDAQIIAYRVDAQVQMRGDLLARPSFEDQAHEAPLFLGHVRFVAVRRRCKSRNCGFGGLLVHQRSGDALDVL